MGGGCREFCGFLGGRGEITFLLAGGGGDSGGVVGELELAWCGTRDNPSKVLGRRHEICVLPVVGREGTQSR